MKKIIRRDFQISLKRKSFKGFTLVEIIVVLVILAVLATAMIPALTGYIDKAKEKTAIAEARNIVTAAQTLASEKYALNMLDEWKSDTNKAKRNESIYKLADIEYDSTKLNRLDLEVDSKGKIEWLVCPINSDTNVSYINGEFKVTLVSDTDGDDFEFDL